MCWIGRESDETGSQKMQVETPKRRYKDNPATVSSSRITARVLKNNTSNESDMDKP